MSDALFSITNNNFSLNIGNGGCGLMVMSNGIINVAKLLLQVMPGTYTVMIGGENINDNGLVMDPGVDTDVWSFDVDTNNNLLKVTYTPPSGGSMLVIQ